MSEPGVTLGRLIAAERNGLAGANLASQHAGEIAELRGRVGALEGQVLALLAQINALQVQAAMARGTGATQR